MCRRAVETSHLGVGEERVRPPDLVQHLVTNAQLLLAGVVEVQSRIVPMLAEVEVQRKVLSTRTSSRRPKINHALISTLL